MTAETKRHNTKQRPALVVGSASLDVLATTDESFEEIVRKKGRIDLSFGGAAHNMAINISMLGMPARYLGSMNDGAVAKMVQNDFAQHNVETYIQTNDDLADSVFVAQFFKGDLVSFIASSPSDQVDFDEDYIEQAMTGCSCVIINCVLKIDVLNKIIACANKNKLPVYGSANTEMRALKLPQLKGKVAISFVNEAEMNYLVTHSDGFNTWQDAADKTSTQYVVTQGAKGLTLLTPQEPEQFFPVDEIQIKGNTLGAGDLIVSAVIFHLFNRKMPLPEALVRAQEIVKQILSQDHVHLGKGNSLRIGIQAIAKQAEFDSLTGLYNRYGLKNFFSTKGVERQRISAILLDVDHFKKINDTFGHNAGDAVLSELGKILRDTLRQGDAVARWGGEELIMLLVNVNAENTLQIAERLREKIAAVKFSEPDDQQVTISAGVAVRDKRESLEQMLHRADQALYKAKHNGRNQVQLFESEETAH